MKKLNSNYAKIVGLVALGTMGCSPNQFQFQGVQQSQVGEPKVDDKKIEVENEVFEYSLAKDTQVITAPANVTVLIDNQATIVKQASALKKSIKELIDGLRKQTNGKVQVMVATLQGNAGNVFGESSLTSDCKKGLPGRIFDIPILSQSYKQGGYYSCLGSTPASLSRFVVDGKNYNEIFDKILNNRGETSTPYTMRNMVSLLDEAQKQDGLNIPIVLAQPTVVDNQLYRTSLQRVATEQSKSYKTVWVKMQNTQRGGGYSAKDIYIQARWSKIVSVDGNVSFEKTAPTKVGVTCTSNDDFKNFGTVYNLPGRSFCLLTQVPSTGFSYSAEQKNQVLAMLRLPSEPNDFEFEVVSVNRVDHPVVESKIPGTIQLVFDGETPKNCDSIVNKVAYNVSSMIAMPPTTVRKAILDWRYGNLTECFDDPSGAFKVGAEVKFAIVKPDSGVEGTQTFVGFASDKRVDNKSHPELSSLATLSRLKPAAFLVANSKACSSEDPALKKCVAGSYEGLLNSLNIKRADLAEEGSEGEAAIQAMFEQIGKETIQTLNRTIILSREISENEEALVSIQFKDGSSRAVEIGSAAHQVSITGKNLVLGASIENLDDAVSVRLEIAEKKEPVAQLEN